MIRKLTAIACLLVVVATACGREGGGGSQTQVTSERKSLKVVALPYVAYGALYIAKEKGYFEDENLDVELVPMFTSEPSLPGLARGQFDAAGSAATPGLINAIARGSKIKAVADFVQFDNPEPNCVIEAIAVRTDLLESGEIKSPKDLKGRKVRGLQNQMEGYALDKFLERDGLSIDDVEMVEIPPPNVPDAFGKNGLDVVMLSDPALGRLLATGKAKVWVEVEKELIPGYQIGNLVFGRNLLEDKDAGIRFLTAFERAVEDYRKGPTDENVRIISKATQVPEDILRRVCWSPFSEDGRIDWGWIDKVQQWMKGRNLIDKTITEDQFWTDEFLGPALERL